VVSCDGSDEVLYVGVAKDATNAGVRIMSGFTWSGSCPFNII